MKVYTYWDFSAGAPERQAEFFRIWERSWSRHGWEPRLLTDWNIKAKHRSIGNHALAALLGVGGGWYSDIRVFNQNLKPFTPRAPLLGSQIPWGLAWMKRPADASRKIEKWPEWFCEYWSPGATGETIYFRSVDEAHQSGLCL